jgi:LDH2 family malate/lactate/ureidoglycolate dehydrogenase
LFLVIDPSAFADLEKFKQKTQELFVKIKLSRKRKGVKEILIPGERAQKKRQETLKKGYFEVKKEVIENIQNLL